MQPTQPRGSVAWKTAASLFPATRVNPQRQKTLDFTIHNAYYVWSRVINEEDGTVIPRDPDKAPLARGYVSDTTTSSAADWIHRQDTAGQPWMATVAYAANHTPYQQAPRDLLPAVTPDISGLSCTGTTMANVVATRIISNQMIEAMDTEIGQLLVRTGLASKNGDGSLNYEPEKTNTMVIVIGDNGTFVRPSKYPSIPVGQRPTSTRQECGYP